MVDSIVERVVLWTASGERCCYGREFAFPVVQTLSGRL
jgi:hypothetical protein